jgi:hypothetical protein
VFGLWKEKEKETLRTDSKTI